MGKFLKFVLIIFIIAIILGVLSGVNKLVNPQQEYRHANMGVIEIDGVIMQSLPVLEQLDEVKKNPQIKALIVRIDSPGGAVGASQEIFMELKKMKQVLPVVVTMGDIAASGGLYASLAGDVVIALPGTLTGSMGVLFQLTNLNRLMDKILVDPITIRSGELKDAGNPMRPLDPKAKQLLEDLVQDTFAMFKNDVQTERKLSPAAIKTLSDGRVVNGEQALKLGLVDKIGTFRDAVDIAKEKAKISGDIELAYLSRKPKAIWDRVFESSMAPIQNLIRESRSVLQYRWEPLK